MVVTLGHLTPHSLSRVSQFTTSSTSTSYSSFSPKFPEIEDELDFSTTEGSEIMDPTYVTSGPGAVLQCLTLCSSSLAQLQHLQREYHNSPPATLEALLAEVRQAARALSGINTLFYDPDRDVAFALESNMDLQHFFDGVLRPTRIIFASLEQEMRGLFLPAYDHDAKEDDPKARARYLFTDNVLKNYLSMVRTDRSVLTMLTTALQMKTPAEVGGMIMMTEPIIADINERASALSGVLDTPDKDAKQGHQDDYFHASGTAIDHVPARTTSMARSSDMSRTSSTAKSPLSQYATYGHDFKAPLSPASSVAAPIPPPPVPQNPGQQSNNPYYSDKMASPQMFAAALLGPPPSTSPPLPEKSRLRGSAEQSPVASPSQQNAALAYRTAPGSSHSVGQQAFLQQGLQYPMSQPPNMPLPQTPVLQSRSRTSSLSRVVASKHLPPTPNTSGIHPLLRQGYPGTDDAALMSASWSTNQQPPLPASPGGQGVIAPLNVRRPGDSRNPSPPGSGQRTPVSASAVPMTQHMLNLQKVEARIAEAAATAAAESSIQGNAFAQSSSMASVLTRNATVSSAQPAQPTAQMPRANTTASVPAAAASRTSMRLFPTMRRTPSRLAKDERIAESAPEVIAPPQPAIPPQFASMVPQGVQVAPQRPQHHGHQPSISLAQHPSVSSVNAQQLASPAFAYAAMAPVGQPQQRPTDAESVYSEDTAAAASSQALPSRNNSLIFNPSSASSPSGESTPTSSKPLAVVDFNVLIPRIMNNTAVLPPRPDDLEEQLRREKDLVLATPDVSDHMRWAEDVLRQDHLMTRYKKRLAKVGYQQVLPTISADGLTLEAKTVIERNAHDGHPRALFLKARWFNLEESVVQEMYLASLSKGYLRSAFYLGKKYETKKDFSTAFEYYRKGSNGHDSACGFRMAKIYLKGELGKKKDHKAAVPILQNAASCADKDSPYAPYLLGMLHTKAYQKTIGLNKKLVPQDAFAARAHIAHAAALGLGQALTNLGKAYAKADNELSLPEDQLTSLHHLYLGSIAGDGEAELELSNCFWWGQQGYWGPNEKIAYMYAKMSANEFHIPAFCQVGYFHERGIGAAIDLSEARAYYLKGASGGDKMAINRLDGLRRSGGRAVLGFQK